MEPSLHPLAPHHMPGFITGPGETDVLMNAMIVILIGTILLVGNLYLQLHSLPERMAHRTTQFQVVAVLGLLALFTHQHIFWILGLLLALVRFPDFSTPLNRIAESLEAQGSQSRPGPPAEASPARPRAAEVDPHPSEESEAG